MNGVLLKFYNLLEEVIRKQKIDDVPGLCFTVFQCLDMLDMKENPPPSPHLKRGTNSYMPQLHLSLEHERKLSTWFSPGL